VHNAYQQRGGEDGVVSQEVDLLRNAGHDVDLEQVSNDSLSGLAAKATAFLNTPHNVERGHWILAKVAATRPDIVHVHNFFPLLTPAIHEGAAKAGAAVVQTLHNYRLVCAGAMLLREGAVCEKCLSGNRLWGVVHRCYRGSLPGSLAVARMQVRADRHRTWHRHVHRFIALTEFARQKFIEGGLPANRIVVKPNFVNGPTVILKQPDRSGALFVGRLSPEKGVATLIEAWRSLPHIPLTIVGTGPEFVAVRASAPNNVKFKGELTRTEVAQEMRSAAMLVVPSIWYEPFGMVVIEAFASALPVVASNIGSLASIVRPGQNGALFTTGNADSLRSVIEGLHKNPDRLRLLGVGARQDYVSHYAPDQNLVQLEAVYRAAIEAVAAPFAGLNA
jgi:glycosyltransferase involved in cell wall biosynthesis